MACEDQPRLVVEPQLMKQEMGARRKLDTALGIGIFLVEVPDVIDMRELGADAADIVPDTSENLLDLLWRFLWKGGGEVGAADPLLPQCGSDQPRQSAEHIGCLVGIEIASGA